MPRDYYKAAIVIYTVQLLLLSVHVNSIIIEKFGAFPIPNMGNSSLILGGLIFVLSIASIFIIRNLYKNSLEIQHHKLDTLKFMHIEEQNRIYLQHRHDLHNHLTVISGLAQLGQMDRLRDYLTSYLDNLNKSIITVDTGLKELDILLSAKISEAKNREIDVDYQCLTKVSCNKEHIIGLTAILANALDNAIQACEKAGQKKSLRIKVTSDVLEYTFEITNTYKPQLNQKYLLSIEGFTSKKGSSRGEGVSIIRKTVSKFRGTVDYKFNDGSCCLIIELPKLSLGVFSLDN